MEMSERTKKKRVGEGKKERGSDKNVRLIRETNERRRRVGRT